MNRHPSTHHRRSLRLNGYDYAQAGAYFVTICTQNRACLFGEVVDGKMRLNVFGEIAREEWFRTGQIRPNVELDAFVIMPNHIHGIIVIRGNVGATRRVAPTKHPAGPVSGSIGAIVGQFKSITAKRINELRGTPRVPVWQRNYHERIIRDEPALARIREYIANNPRQWTLDRLNPRHAETKDAGSLRRPTP